VSAAAPVASAAGPLVHLIDASVYVFRAYHALPPMLAPDGTPTHAAYGFTNTCLRYLREAAVAHAAVCFDHSMRSFRNELEPGYKAQRGDPPADLEPNFAIASRAAAAIGLAVFEAPDFEADDCIATLAAQVLAQGGRAVVVSSDKDLAQLVREDGRVVLHDFARGQTLDAAGVRGRFGVDPAQIPDWLGLVGDAVDNLPGVPGVGPKRAAALLRAFGRIEAIPDDPRAWEGVPLRGAARLALRVAQHRERALRTRDLARLRSDVPGLRVGIAGFRCREPDPQRVRALFEGLGWGRIATRALERRG
jgi:DNA polymerase-1